MRSNVLLDLDGTLINSLPGIVKGMINTLESLGVAVPAEEELVRYIGPPLDYGFGQMLQTDDEAAIDKAVTTYREYYRDRGIFDCNLYDGVPELLEATCQAGRSLFLVTSKPEPFARQLLDHFGLMGFFGGVHGATFDPSRARKVDVLRHALATSKLAADSAVMVGDRDQDLLAAAENGTAAIGVLWGYGSREELQGCPFDILVQSPAELLERLLP